MARSISTFGSNLAPVALALAVLSTTDSPMVLALVIGVRTVPFVVFLLIGGVVADRRSRRRVMAYADATRFVSQGLTAVLLTTGDTHLAALLILQGVSGTADAFHRPSSNGLLRELVTRAEDLQPANAALSLSNNLASILGPLCASALALSVGASWGLLIDAATFGVSALLMLRLPPVGTVDADPDSSFRTELVEGWRAVRTRSWLGLTIGAAAVMQTFTYPALWVLGPMTLAGTADGTGTWGVVGAALAAGAILGDLVAFQIRPARPLLVECIFAGAFVVLPVSLALTHDLRILAAAASIAGFGLSISDTMWLGCLQRFIPENLMSRVSSFDWLGSTALRPLGYLAVGWLAGVAGPRVVLFAAGGVLLAVQLALSLVPSIRNLGAERLVTRRRAAAQGALA
jgi:MFS family permease